MDNVHFKYNSFVVLKLRKHSIKSIHMELITFLMTYIITHAVFKSNHRQDSLIYQTLGT